LAVFPIVKDPAAGIPAALNKVCQNPATEVAEAREKENRCPASNAVSSWSIVVMATD
jgi:hypothetical protein